MLFSGKVDLNDLHDRDRAESAGEALGAGMVFAEIGGAELACRI
jgi:hypothetical protein